jgi:hypothetical protein
MRSEFHMRFFLAALMRHALFIVSKGLIAAGLQINIIDFSGRKQ